MLSVSDSVVHELDHSAFLAPPFCDCCRLSLQDRADEARAHVLRLEHAHVEAAAAAASDAAASGSRHAEQLQAKAWH